MHVSVQADNYELSDMKSKAQAAGELRDAIEVFREGEMSRFLTSVLPAIIDILRAGEPAFRRDAPEHLYRHALVDTLHRLPLNEQLKVHAPTIMALVLHLLRRDNEENGVTCIKIIIDLNRSYRTSPEEHVTQFIEFVQDLYKNTKTLVNEYFDPGANIIDQQSLAPSMHSFKVLTECPIATVLLFQSHRNVVNPTVRTMLPLVIDFLVLEAKPQKRVHEEALASGELWMGVAPDMSNKGHFAEFVTSQVKTMSFLAYVLRGANDSLRAYQDQIPRAIVRMLQDCPPEAAATRKELLIATRHVLSTEFRTAFVPQIDTLLNEKVLIGTASLFRPLAFSMLADLVHHVRTELNPLQLGRVIHIYSCNLHNQSLNGAIQTMCAKLLMNLVECVLQKDTPEGSVHVLQGLLITCIDKLGALHAMQQDVVASNQRIKDGEQDKSDVVLIEKAKPMSSAAYVNETLDEVLKESRYLFRTLLHGFRTVLTSLKTLGQPMLDGELLGRMFEGTINCMSLYELPANFRDEREAMEWFSHIFHEMHPHVFQELWATKIEFFFESALKRPTLFHLPQVLLAHQPTCGTLTSIILRFLVARFDTLGHQDSKMIAVQTIRFFKMAFQAVTMFPEQNEGILVPYLGRLVMDSFPLAAKSPEPTNYFLLLRGLFRSIGGAGGRFELLYKEVLPLLPEMLESLNRLLLAAGPSTRDLLVELCLTVPVRLTHLLPFLHYLMQPLVFALRGNPELISQGLRTLELCIDNLTQEFLDPTLSPVLRDLMGALHAHLKPQPASHQHAHTTVRILGKLGGRNRRLLDQNPQLEYQEFTDPATLPVKFVAGREEYINLGPISELAARSLRHDNQEYRREAYEVLKQCMTVLLRDGIHGPERVDVFQRVVQGLFDAVHVAEFRAPAEEYIRDLSRHVLSMEITGSVTNPADAGNRRMLHRLVTLYLDTIPFAMAKPEVEEAKAAQQVVVSIIDDLLDTAKSNIPFSTRRRDPSPVLDQLAHRFVVTCFEETWPRKVAGCKGIIIMTSEVDLGTGWIRKREPDFIRALFFVLKDMPNDPPANISEALDAITHIIRICRGHGSSMEEDGVDNREEISYLVKVLIVELSSTNATVRKAAQTTLELLGELSGDNISELMLPHRDRLLSPIFTKPLRALPLSTQIGNIDAIRYCLDLKPYLLDVNEELLRLLHEALALADAEDAALIGRNTQRRSTLEVVRLRVVCIKLLTASMPLTDFFSKQHQTRQRVIGVYFKSLYSPSLEVKNVAHEGLRLVLTHQTRLPKDLLQTGLRPILMNLADPKRLSVPGLEGLARLLELLTNYFKVEIGSKLLDHFRVIADPSMLRNTAYRTLTEHEEITKLVGLVHIFHLLPPTANIFLKDLVTVVVDAEACLESSAPSPLTEPLGKFLNRYPGESVEFFLRRLGEPRYVRTLRNVLLSQHAPLLEREIGAQTPSIIAICLQGNNRSLILPGMLILGDLAALSDVWLVEHGYVIDALLVLWHTELRFSSGTSLDPPAIRSRQITVMREIFTRALEQSPRIDLLFDIVEIYTHPSVVDLSGLTNFLYRHVAMSQSDSFRRNILLRFLNWFENPSPSWAHKTVFVRHIINPLLYVTFSRDGEVGHIVDPDVINHIHSRIWRPMSNSIILPTTDDALSIELLHLSSLIVHHCSSLIQDVRKDIIKCAWSHITVEDAVVKQTAYILAARFFEAFDSPAKFILRTWTGLLRPPHAEGRTLIRQALDILAPALPKRIPQEPGYPSWAKLTRRMLIEEGHGLSQLIVIYQLVVRHPSLFYSCRELFVPHMVSSLSKLGLQPSATWETRTLSLDLLDLIMAWERQAKQALTPDATIASRREDSPQVEKLQSSPWALPLNHRETIVSYLVRLVVTSNEPVHKAGLIMRALGQLQALIGPNGWSEVTVKLNFFIRALEQLEFTEQNLVHISNSAKVFAVVTADKPLEWYSANGGLLQRLIQKGMSSDESILHDSLHPAFKKLLEVFPMIENDDETQNDGSDFHTWVSNAILESLRTSNNLKGPLLMLLSMVQSSPARIEPFAAGLMKLLVKATKDHITQQASNPEEPIQQITSVLEICRISVAHLADQRRHFLHCLVQIADKSNSEALCTLLLSITREWVLHRKEAYPTLKEKASLLSTMKAFEQRGQALFGEYLQLIYDIYKEESLRRTDLTMRLEPSYLLACRAKDPVIRSQCIDLLDNSIPRTLSNRLSYVLGVQNWEALTDHYWLHLALDLLLGAIDGEEPLNLEHTIFQSRMSKLSMSTLQNHVRDLVQPIRRLLFLDPNAVHLTWVSVFSAIWASLSRKEQADLTNTMIILLSKDHLNRQVDLRPNVVQTLLAGVKACSPPMSLPPYLLKYLGKTFGAWHICLEILQDSLDHLREEESIQDTTYDSLAELYAELAEDDMFYGLWRRRCLYPETNCAVSLEQNGLWPQAQAMYEAAQVKSRTGVIPFSEAEYCLWEDHWILAAEKLQQWEILEELSKSEGNQDLLLECRWRNPDWTADQETLDADLNGLEEIATPRRRVFQAYAALNKATWPLEKNGEFTRHLEEAIQLSLRKWVALPSALSKAHVPLLQHFQQFVELQEAAQIFGSLAQTNAQNLEKKSSDLKLVLQAWRERLPNLADDISIWSDLVAWRQHVFYAINRHYLPLIQPPPGPNVPNNPSTFGFRGYHETAWLVNRFAHVARKHHLLEVCHQSLNKIYTLPNIEIAEAFLKLREQARCHYQNPNELQAGLDVINNTNLVYFSTSQKAEFYTLKGMFFAKLGHTNEANVAFGQAVGMELNMPKAWAEWGRYSDEMFKEHPNELSHAGNAVSCYLQAAGLYKTAKSRPLLIRVLWLLSLDDPVNPIISSAFDNYKGEAAFWYWITLIPQLLLSLGHREAKNARYILLSLAKLYPQALFWHLRTTKDDFASMRSQAAAAAAARAHHARSATPSAVSTIRTEVSADGDVVMGDATKQESSTNSDSIPGMVNVNRVEAAHVVSNGVHSGTPATSTTSREARQPWEYVEEIVAILKTAFPLLALTLETIQDQLKQRFKPSNEEDNYRILSNAVAAGLNNLHNGLTQLDTVPGVPEQSMEAIETFLRSVTSPVTKAEFEEDFKRGKLTLREYIRRMMQWRDKYEKLLDSRPRFQSLDTVSKWLVEFQHGKFDEVEVPGQYLEHKEVNSNFTRIMRFAPKVEFCRGNGFTFKRITLIGHDGTKHSFAVQMPTQTWVRREERIQQLFRIFNGVLNRRKESRKRNLCFHLPVAVPLNPTLRLLANDSSYVTMQHIYDEHCDTMRIAREDPQLAFAEKFESVYSPSLSESQVVNLRAELQEEIMAKMVPENIISNYMTKTMKTSYELWTMRKQFALQLASTTFMTYIMCLTSRLPSRFHISRSTGLIYMSELMPAFDPNSPRMHWNEATPFRLTPNMQHFLNPIGIEGLLTSGIMAIARSLTEPEFDMEQQLSLFIRDEVMTWYTYFNKSQHADTLFRQHVLTNIDIVVSRAEHLSCRAQDKDRERGGSVPPVPAVQTITSLVSAATNPLNLAKQNTAYYPWF
ncbi:hypothetical protein K439DRAFT_1323691 [Ramaria rubella]|nr:hypothetical protein K439DRAFT_1323691 [Ramaria rubella]